MTAIPIRYLPMRVASLVKQRVLRNSHAKAAALFCYFEEHEWLLYSGVSTNFPKGYKVQSSPKKMLSPHVGKSQDKPPRIEYFFLREFLVEGNTFANAAMKHWIRHHAQVTVNRPPVPSQRTLHRQGRELLRRYLENFDKQLEGQNAVDHSGKSA